MRGLEDVGVQHIAVGASPEQVQDSVWESIVQLTRLSGLNLVCVAQRAASPAFAAISSLTRLTCVGAGSWAPAVLSVLQTLPKLKVITGSWEAGSSGGVTLTGVRALVHCTGSVPFEAFPSLRSFHHAGAVTAAAFSAIAEHCTGLRSFAMQLEDRSGQHVDIATLAPDEPLKLRVAAIQSFSSLTALS